MIECSKSVLGYGQSRSLSETAKFYGFNSVEPASTMHEVIIIHYIFLVIFFYFVEVLEVTNKNHRTMAQ